MVRFSPFTLLPVLLERLFPTGQSLALGQRLARGGGWALVGALSNRAMALVTSILVARLLGKVGFGEFGIIQSTLDMVLVLAGFSMGITTTKYVSEFRISDPARAGRVYGLTTLVALISGAGMGALLWLFAPALAGQTLAAPHLAPLIRVAAVALALSAVLGSQSGMLAGLEAFQPIARINVVSGSFRLLIMGV